MSDRDKAIILLSGGLDSSTTLAISKSEGYEPYGLTFRYGQRHHMEIDSAKRVAETLGVHRHTIIDIDLRVFGGSALTDNIEVPKNRDMKKTVGEIPITYVPARNTIFLSYALAFAEVIEMGDIFIGVNALDYSGYPDCRPDYIQAFERMANLGTKAGVEGRTQFKIHTPLIQKTKAQIIRTGLKLGVDYSITNSCYDPSPDGAACGQCDACKLRLIGFAEAGVKDPVTYQN